MEKQQVFYIHGGEAFSTDERYHEHLRTVEINNPTQPTEKPKRWVDAIREDLGDEFEVFTPQMPNKGKAKYEEWKIWFERHFPWLHDGVVLIGWSQGGMFLVKYLQDNNLPFAPKALILIAAPNYFFELGPEDGGDFNIDTERVSEIVSKVGDIHILHSKDDFVVSYEHALRYQAALPEATLHTFADKNHFLIEEFPELLDLIKDIAGK